MSESDKRTLREEIADPIANIYVWEPTGREQEYVILALADAVEARLAAIDGIEERLAVVEEWLNIEQTTNKKTAFRG